MKNNFGKTWTTGESEELWTAVERHKSETGKKAVSRQFYDSLSLVFGRGRTAEALRHQYRILLEERRPEDLASDGVRDDCGFAKVVSELHRLEDMVTTLNARLDAIETMVPMLRELHAALID